MVTEFNQEAWLKFFTDMSTELTEKSNNFEMHFFKLINNSLCVGKTIENVRNHRDVKLVTTDKKGVIWCKSLTTIRQNAFLKNYMHLK